VSDFFTESVLIATVASSIRLAVPLLLASLGESYGQRSGVLNLGVDGIMLLGAFFGYYAVLRTGNVWFGLLIGIVAGLLLGVMSAVMAVTLQAEQGISGIGVFLFGLGMSDLLFQRLVGTPLPITKFPKLDIPGLSDIPWLGEMLFRHSMIVYIAFLAIPVSMFIINRGGACDRPGDLSAEHHQCHRLHRHCPGLLRSVAPARRHGRVAALRFRQRSGAAVQDTRHHSAGLV
jgi:simple sugar transport system permease protein